MKRKMIITALAGILLFNSCSSNDNVQNYVQPESTDTADAHSSEESESNEIVINMAVCNYDNWGYNDPVNTFNKMVSGCRINIIDYEEYYLDSYDSDETAEAYQSPDNKFVLDFMTNNDIDIVVNFMDDEKFISLAKKGAFVNLDDYLETDDEVNFDTINNHVLKLCRINDELCYIPLSFSVDTVYGKEKYVGNEECWNVSEMINRWYDKSENLAFIRNSSVNYASNIFWELCARSTSGYIDAKNNKCNFSSPDFIDMLNFINEFDDENAPEKGDLSERDYFLATVNLTGFRQFHELMSEQEEGSTLSFVGYPTNDSGNSFIDIHSAIAVSASSAPEKQKYAWQFIKFLEGESYQEALTSANENGIINENDFPINKNVFEKRAEHFKTTDNKYYKNDVVLDLGRFTDEEYDKLLEIIEGCNNLVFGSSRLESVVYSEIDEMLFNSASPEQVAEKIQNKLTIMLNEQG